MTHHLDCWSLMLSCGCQCKVVLKDSFSQSPNVYLASELSSLQWHKPSVSGGTTAAKSRNGRQQVSFWRPCRHKAARHVLLCLRQLLDPAVSLPPGTATGRCSRQSHRVPGSLHDGLVPHALELWPAAAWPLHATNSSRCALLLLCWAVLWSFGLQLLGQSMPPTKPGALSCWFVKPAACAVQHWFATSLCFVALLDSYLANPCHLLSQVHSPAGLLGCALKT